MAIQFTYETATGLVLDTAYAKITKCSIDYKNKIADISVELFIDEAARTAGKDALQSLSINYPSSFALADPKDIVARDAFFDSFMSAENMNAENTNLLVKAYELVAESQFFKTKSPIAV